MKKLFLCDIDGTIIDGSRSMNEVSDKTKYAIRQLAKDNYVFIASGRCKGLLEKQILDLGVNGYILCNGAYAEVNGKTIYSEAFDHQTIEHIKKTTLDNNGFYILEALNDVYVNDVNCPKYINFMKGWGESMDSFKQYDNEDKPYHICMIGFGNEEDCKACELSMGDKATMIRHNFYRSYDVNINGINKGIGAKRVMEYLNIDIDNTYCFGDGANDLEMLQAVGHPVIMANADNKIKQYGFEETHDVLDDGFYRYLVDNLLIKPL